MIECGEKYWGTERARRQLSYSEFVETVLASKVDSVKVTNSELIASVPSSGESRTSQSISTPRLPSVDESWLIKELRDHEVQIIAEPQTQNWWSGRLFWLFPNVDARVPLLVVRAIAQLWMH